MKSELIYDKYLPSSIVVTIAPSLSVSLYAPVGFSSFGANAQEISCLLALVALISRAQKKAAAIVCLPDSPDLPL